MTDELYDYFGGNASKKVEPIEDDELDVQEVDSEDTSEAVQEDAAVESEVNEVVAEEEQKSGGHWDSLLGMLGIGGSKASSKPAAKPKKATPAKEPVAKKPRVEKKSKKFDDAVSKSKDETVKFKTDTKSKSDPAPTSGFAGFDPIPNPEDDTVLPSMFAPSKSESESSLIDEVIADEPVNEADDLIGWAAPPKKSFSSSESDDKPVRKKQTPRSAPQSKAPAPKPPVRRPEPVAKADAFDIEEVEEEIEGEEYVEFEIEELDNSPYEEGEEVANGRSRRRRPARGEEPREDSVEKNTRPEPKAERGRRPRRGARDESSRDESSAEDRPRRGRGARNESSRDESSEGSRPRRGRGARSESSRDEGSSQDRPRRGARSESSREESSDDRPRQSRSRSGRSGRDEPKRDSRTPARSASRGDHDHDIPVDDEFDVEEAVGFVEDDDDSEQEEKRPKRKRRRRRRKPRSADASRDEGSDDPRGENDSDDDDDLDVESFDDETPIGDERDTVELARDEARGRSGGRGRGRNSGRGRGGSEDSSSDDRSRSRSRKPRKDDRDDDDDRPELKRAKVPTWDEAISVVVESNIKNHARSGGGGGGRRRSSGNRNQGGGGDRGGSGGRGGNGGRR